jgi:hypothetical protein
MLRLQVLTGMRTTRVAFESGANSGPRAVGVEFAPSGTYYAPQDSAIGTSAKFDRSIIMDSQAAGIMLSASYWQGSL